MLLTSVAEAAGVVYTVYVADASCCNRCQ